jgi:cytochrome c553
MKRLLRILVSAATAISLVLCAATMVLWIRGYQTSDKLEWHRVSRDPQIVGQWYLAVSSGRGGLGISRDAELYDAQSAIVPEPAGGWKFAGWTREPPIYPEPVFFHGGAFVAQRFSLRLRSRVGRPTDPRRELIVPCWAVAAPLAALPLARGVRAWSRNRRKRAGLCRRCHYNLRGNVSGVCPECGTAITVTK